MEYEPCCGLAELDAPEENQQQAGTDEQRMRWEAWSGLAPLQPCRVGAQAGARRGSRKEAAKPIQPRDALSSPHGSTLHTEPCHGCTNSCALHSLPNFPSAHCQKKQPGPPFASSTEEKKGKKKKGHISGQRALLSAGVGCIRKKKLTPDPPPSPCKKKTHQITLWLHENQIHP